MNTQTHMLMGAVLFGRPLPRFAWAAVAGAIAPDVPMYVIVAGLRMAGYPMGEIFDRLYWAEWWQVANAIGHSLLLWGCLVAISLLLLPRRQTSRGSPRPATDPEAAAVAPGLVRRVSPLVFAFSGSALLHAAIDFLVHRDDAHMQFWPLSEWRFRSPISYWDPAHGGHWFGLFEAALGTVLIVVLSRRHRSRAVRAVLALALLLYGAVPAYFVFGLAHH
jgi:hypothetical protein